MAEDKVELVDAETLQHAIAIGPSLLKEKAIPTTTASTGLHHDSAGVSWITTDEEDELVFKECDGDVFCDGSCFFSTHSRLAAAGWACVQVDSEGNLLKAMYGCVPAHIEQTAVNAKHCALVCAASAIETRAQIACDCAAVVNGW